MSRNSAGLHPVDQDEVTSREGRVSRNLAGFTAINFTCVTSREGRVSRNYVRRGQARHE